jgi:xanthine dehydrogenase YagR molybdenum-binding subunit
MAKAKEMREASENRYYQDPDEPYPTTPEPEEELEPWQQPTTVVGTKAQRIDAYERVSGSAQYTYDVILPDMLHAAVLRCPHAHADIRRLNTKKAEKMPGVRAVITHETPDTDIPWYTRAGEPQSKLFDPRCRHEGEEVAAVAAETELQAHDALLAIEVDYDVLPHVIDPEEALEPDAPTVHGDTNLEEDVILQERGDIEQGFADADVTVLETFTVGAHIHAPMESFGSVAKWEGKDLTIWDSTQGVYTVMFNVGRALGVSYNNVRVICPYVGGGFGAKLRTGKYTVIAALLARMTARPVKLFLSREETFKCVGNRPAAKMTVKAGARKDGTLTALQLKNISTGGAYGGNRYGVSAQFRELYLCPNVVTEEHWAYTHTGQARAMRAPGFPQASFALEQIMDMLAEKLEMDPIEFRAKNVPTMTQDEEPRPYTSTGLRECMVRGGEAFGWTGARTSNDQGPGARGNRDPGARGDRGPGARSDRGPGAPGARATGGNTPDHIRRGVGMAACNWWAGDGGPPSTATVKMFVDGSVTIRTGASDLGTGTKTVAAMVVAEELSVPLDRINVVHADTGTTPFHYSSGGSQTLPGAIPAVRQAAHEVKKQLLAYAAEELSAPVHALTIEDNAVKVSGDPENQKPIPEIIQSHDVLDIIGVGYRGPNPEDKVVRPFAAQFAEVEVNMRTGEVQVLRLLGAHESGRVINRTTFDNQVYGGMVQGLGFGMTEHRVIDRDTGKVVTANLHDYKIPTALDVPADHESLPIDPGDTECNNLGSKGLGEPPVIPTAAAIANAVYHATGVRPVDAPIGPLTLLAALTREGGNTR